MRSSHSVSILFFYKKVTNFFYFSVILIRMAVLMIPILQGAIELIHMYEAAMLRSDERQKEGILENTFSKYPDGYGILTRDMADKLEEICDKYGLMLESEDLVPSSVSGYEDILELMQMENFIEDSCTMELQVSAACPEGNWHGDYEMLDKDGKYLGDGQIDVSHKGVLNSCGIMSVGLLSDWEEWDYVNKNNDSVTLMINQAAHCCMILYCGAEDFVSVSVGAYYTDGERIVFSDGADGYVNEWGETVEQFSLTKQELEEFADHFLFSKISKAE